MATTKKKRLLVTTSTFPRWKGDTTPAFVKQFCRSIVGHFEELYVLAPHASGAQTHETEDNLNIRRYRYFFPASQENILYEGGGIGKIKKTPLYAFKLLCLLIALFCSTLSTAVRKRISIINAHWIIPQGFIAVIVASCTKKKSVITVHGGDILALKGSFMTKIKRFVLKRADAVVVNSTATLRACEAVYVGANYQVIPMGIDASRFRPIPKSKDLEQRYELKDFTVLFVGRLSEEKGVKYLLEALKELKSQKVLFNALIIGDGILRRDLEGYVRKNGLVDEVTFVGWVDPEQLPAYYGLADVFVGPSLREAQGLVFVEALSMGVPIIATNVDALPDIVIEGKTGFLVKPNSSGDILEKLMLLHDNPRLRKRLGTQSVQHVGDRFDWSVVSKQYIKLFDSL